MIIRYETDRDHDAIDRVIAAAFAPMPFSLQNEHRIVAASQGLLQVIGNLATNEGSAREIKSPDGSRQVDVS